MKAESWLKRPLAWRLYAAVLVTAVPLIVIGVLLFLFWFEQRRLLVLDANVQQARLGAAFVSGWVEGHLRTLITLAAANEVRFGMTPDKQALIERQVHAQPTWEDLFITDARGTIIAGHIRKGVSIADRDYFHSALATGKPVISNLLVSRLTGRPIINIAVPYYRNGTFHGVVVASINPDHLQAIFSGVPSSTATVIALWGSDQRLIARSGSPASMLGRISDGNDPRIFSGRSGTAIIRSSITHDRLVIAYQPVPGTPWVIVAGVEYALALVPVYRAVAIFAIMSLLVLISMLWWSLRTTRHISEDFGKIINASQALGSGNFATRVVIHPSSDLALLGEMVNHLAERLEVSGRLKFDLITLVSHELKTPLTAVLSAVELVPRTPENQELLAIAYHQADHLREMIDNLISVARMQAGTLVARSRPLQLRPLIVDLIQHMDKEHNHRKIPFVNEVPESLRVIADPQMTNLALHNLLENARKFTDDGAITIRAWRDNGLAVITVTDTGIGFDPETARRFFQPFTQQEMLLTRRHEGAGMGLAVVKAVIEVQGGTAFAESTGPGQGSTFGFTLPGASGEAPGK